ncbi:MAG: Lrp/AsnC family transcriptional regulator [Pseudomonadota bacterium]
MTPDRYDHAILDVLNTSARAPVAAIAERVNLSASAVSRRLTALEKAGIIRAYTTIIDGDAIGLPMIVFVEVRLKSLSSSEFDAFERAVQAMPHITDCFLMSGNVDYLIRMRARDMAHFEQMHRNELAKLPGVERLTTRFGLRTVKVAGNRAPAG